MLVSGATMGREEDRSKVRQLRKLQSIKPTAQQVANSHRKSRDLLRACLLLDPALQVEWQKELESCLAEFVKAEPWWKRAWNMIGESSGPGADDVAQRAAVKVVSIVLLRGEDPSGAGIIPAVVQ